MSLQHAPSLALSATHRKLCVLWSLGRSGSGSTILDHSDHGTSNESISPSQGGFIGSFDVMPIQIFPIGHKFKPVEFHVNCFWNRIFSVYCL